MALDVGTRLGPYEVVAPLGAGGMGEVCKARDTRLDRTVAIKILPPSLAADTDRRARFEREAKTIAALNHPHICTLHDVGNHEGSLFLVMEHVAGETLAERLRKGPLPVDQALTVATEIADALAVAHRHGVIHRDLKPANVMLTKAGVKLLDFGLAKLCPPADMPSVAATSLPTAQPTTEKGLVLGTVPYMAPEQLEGKEADAHSDIFSFGAVLYEMLAGRRAFEGASAASVIAAILERTPSPLSVVQPLTPPALDRLVRRCLAKAPDDRPDSAHDVADDLRWMRETSSVGARPEVRTSSFSRRMLRPAAMVLVGILVGAALASWIWARRLPLPPPAPPVRTRLDVQPAEELNSGSLAAAVYCAPTPGGSHTAFAWTPDGRALVFVGRRGGTQQLYVRELEHEEARPLPGTEGAQLPAVSPDGQSVAFWAEGKLKKVPLGTGPVVDVALVGGHAPPMGLSWDDRGNLYFGNPDDRHIWRVSADGGVPACVTTNAKTEWAQILPWPLPGGQVLLYTVRKRDVSWGDEEIVAQNLVTGSRTVLLRDAVDARYIPTGHLVFLRRGVLCAVAFDIERLEPRGAAVALFGGVVQALTGSSDLDMSGAGQFAIAPTGTLAWLPGRVIPYPDTALVSVDRHGRVTPLPASPKSYAPGVRLAPGGRLLAVTVHDLNEVSLWLYDLVRHTVAPLIQGTEAWLQVWAPDGQRLVFSWLKDGRSALAVQRADGSTAPEVLGVGADDTPSSWSPNGRELFVVTFGGHLAVITMENGGATEKQLTHTPYRELWPEVSPDGRWLAYASDESGRFEVYVEPYPSLGPRTLVSVEGGVSPAWDGKGQELFFLSLPGVTGKRRMMAARFEPGRPTRIGPIRSLFECPDSTFFGTPVRAYDVAPDGQRFYTIQPPPPPSPQVVTDINLLQNWFEELKAKVPLQK